MEWTDTTEYRLTADAFPGSERAVITYHATASDAPGMRKGITLQSSGSYDRTGTRTQADQELQMASKGTRRGAHQLGLDGVLVSAQGNEAGDMTITVPTVGQTVPVKQSGSYSITASPHAEPSDPAAPSAILLLPAALVAWLLAVWPPPFWYRTHWPAETAFMAAHARRRPPAATGPSHSTPSPPACARPS